MGSTTADAANTPTDVLGQIAQQVFGYEHLRPGQREVLEAVLSGRDTLAVMPTGAGKSAIYQIAGLRIQGVTLVVSPLIALQHDQVEGIIKQGVVKAAVLNSTLSKTERKAVFEQLKSESLEFLFLAPEQLSNEETLASIKAFEPSLFVVDEAHCVSEWGHDFRPDYLQLGSVIEALNHPITLALTATASPLVRQEIVERLGMSAPLEIVKGFDRPSIHLSVHQVYEESDKLPALISAVTNAVAEEQKPGIIYAATRKATEEIAQELQDQGLSVAAYHAGMKGSDRDTIQTQFMHDKLDAIIATTAFGMGIDKANVRFVYHYHIPSSIDAYYQEIGRAARDGENAIANLFYWPDDMKLQRFFTGGGQVDEETLFELAELIETVQLPLSQADLLKHFSLSQAKLATALESLEAAGLIERGTDGEIWAVEAEADLDSTVERAMTQQHRHRQFNQSRLHMMQGYAETKACRREYILSYFGEAYEPSHETNCGSCDNCQKAKEESVSWLEPFPLGSTIIHTNFGKGQVMRYEEDKINVLFETVGYKTFVTEMIAHSVTCLSSSS
ncbi:MAG: ATP-dependent DNA helicase RecQ [Phormidesmis sp.]